MSRSLRRGTLAATALAFSIVSLAACGAGNDAQTLAIKPDNAAISVDNGKIKIQNALVITQPLDEKTKKAGKGDAVVAATVFNNGDKPQTLDAIKLDGSSATVKLTSGKAEGAKTGPITVPAGGSVVIGGKDNASAVVPSGSESESPLLGKAQPVTFSFSETGDVTLKAFVVPSTGHFEGFGPDKLPATPAPTGSPTGSPSGTPASGAPGGTPTGAASGTPAKQDPKKDAKKDEKNTPSGAATTGAGAGR
ncbi:hypothetical protein GCM10010329_17030 [Streptomyces spiroverticillatus]|uniref:DUF461 domain-containing protein n=1 Tax=Streptomyces finlayi TaxID=67296 RepID=A0A919C7Y2_9ACTN|nr:DUF461 domain-containing protein [Streptomyces finlayi]GGZ96414.1 hypothetical protein GCM10010329_17030 [Streptomyces spiroverticillatus]GHC81825.1 hypothetical protein GCM10010334_09510 [Streptomyces finlayi]